MSTKKNESKKTEAPQEQPESTQPVESAAAVDATAEAGADVDRPEDAPTDGAGFEGVTVVIIAANEAHGALAARSVKQNLKGVDCQIECLPQGVNTLAETLQLFIDHRSSAERIVLMTDKMLLLNPVTLADIAVIKGKRYGERIDYDLRMPIMLHRSVLQVFLPEMIAEYPHGNLVSLYFEAVYGDIRPIDPLEWNKSCWLLPVISKNPPIDVVKKWAETQKFLFVSKQSWSDDLVKFLDERFGE